MANSIIARLKRLSGTEALILHLIVLLFISVAAFHHNISALLVGNDGPTGYSLAEEQLTYFGISPNFHSNLLEGLGNISLPYNLSVQPGYWLGAFYKIGKSSTVWLYTWFALQLFITTLLIGWNYKFSTRQSYAAAWLLTLLMLPYFNVFHIYSITSSMPNFIGNLTVFALMSIGIQHMGEKSWLQSLKYGAILFLGLVFGLITAPALLILISPPLLFTTLLALATASSRNALVRKLLIAAFILAVIAALGWLEFLLGLFLNAAGVFFNSDMRDSGVNTSSLIFSSILFHGKLDAMQAGPWLFCLGTLGAFIAAFYNITLRGIAITILTAQLFIIGGGQLAMIFMPVFSSISIIYFELYYFHFMRYLLFT